MYIVHILALIGIVATISVVVGFLLLTIIKFF